jgi:hypothetical protein
MFRRIIITLSSGSKSKPVAYHYEAGSKKKLLLDPVYGGGVFLRKVGLLSPDSIALCSRGKKSF